jgi:hypothetical protein
MNLISNKDLYDLVKSLSKSEKRFLKLHAAANKLPVEIISFFDDIESDVDYTAERYKKKGYSETLYDFILKTLRLFYAGNNASFLIRDEITNILNLFDKAQYKQCRKILNKQKQDAYAYERFHFVLELIGLEKMLITVENQFNIRNNTLENLIKEEEIVIAKAKNFGEYALLFSKINLNTRQKNKAKTQQDLKAIAAFLNSPLLKNEKLILSNKALIIYRHCRSILFCRCQDNESRETECQLLLELMDAHPNLIEEMPNRYITTLNNLINIAFEEHKFKTCQQRIDILQKKASLQAFNTTELQLKIKAHVLNAQLTIYTNTGNFKEAEKTVQEIEAVLKTYKEKINSEEGIVFDYIIGIMYFYFHDYKKANIYMARVLNQSNKLLREDIQTFAKLLNIGLNYELGNFKQLNYIIQTLKQNKSQQVSHFKTENLLLHYYEKLSDIKINKKETELVIFKSLKKDLKEVMKDSHEHNVNYYFEIECYIDSKLTGKKMSQLVSEKYKKACLN